MDELIHVNHRGADVFLSCNDDCNPKVRIWTIAKNVMVPNIMQYSKVLNTKKTYNVSYDPVVEQIRSTLR